MKDILITGGAGFIGSHLVRLMVNKYPEYRIINLDKLTYAGNLANLKDIEKKPNYVFEKADICDFPAIQAILKSIRSMALFIWLPKVMEIVRSKIRFLSLRPM